MALTAITQDFLVASGLVVQGTNVASSSTSTGGLLSVRSGAAISKNLIVGSTATIWGPIQGNDSLSVLGLSTLTGTLWVGGATTLNNTLSVANTATLKSDLSVTGASTLTGTLFVGNATTLNNTLSVANTATLKSDLSVAGITTMTGTLWVGQTGTFNSDLVVKNNSTLTGTLYVGGNSALNGTLSVTGASTLTSTLYVGGDTTLHSKLAVGSDSTLTGALFVGGVTTLNSTTTINGVTSITDTTVADSTAGTAALKVAGGEYIGKNLVVMSTTSNTGTLVSNAIYTPGGVGIGGGLAVSGTAVFKSDVYFTGQTTYAYSTNTVYSDNLLELHTPPNGINGVWTLDDGKDIGLRFHYYNGANKNAAMVLANDTKWFEFYADGNEIGGVFSSVNYATLKAGALNLVGGTASTNTGTGDLIIAGGVGVSGDIYLKDETGTYNKLHGTATQADNLNGGGSLQIPFQTSTNVTAYVPAPTINEQVLSYDAVSGTLKWVLAQADTATNLRGGQKYYIPYQKDVSKTTLTNHLEYNFDQQIFIVDGFSVYTSATTTALYGSDIAMVSSATNSIGMYSDTSVNLVTTGGNLKLAANGNVTQSTGTFTAPFVNPTSLTTGRVTFYNSSTGLVDDGGLTYSTAGKQLTAGNITAGVITGTTTIFATSSTAALGSASAGSIQTLGGIGIAKDIYVGTTATVNGTFGVNSVAPTLGAATGGAVAVSGGVGIAKDLYVGSTTTIKGTLFVDKDVTINANLNVEGTIFVKGTSLTGIDQISGSTGTFVDVVATGTSYLGTVTATNTMYVGKTSTFNQTATFNSDVFVNGTVFVQGASLTGIDKITGSTGTFVDVVSTGTAYLNNLQITGSTTSSGHIYVTNTDDVSKAGSTVTNASIATLGGIKAAKGITAGGVISAGDKSAPSNTTSTNGFFLLNNMQAARTIVSTATTGVIQIDAWDSTMYTSAKYTVQVWTSGAVHIEEIMLVQTGGNAVYISEYGIIYTTGTALGAFSADISNNNVILTFTPTSALTGTIQVVRQSILTAAEAYC